jgi:hypothetical protein
MLVKVAFALAALFAVLAILTWFLRAPPQNIARVLRRIAIITAIAMLVYLAATGRLHWLFVLLGTLLAFLPRLLPLLPIVGGIYKRYQAAKAAQSAGRGAPSGRVSQVETRHIRMSLNHDTGEIDGIVLDGRFNGARLTELSIAQLIELLRECRVDDAESAQLVQAFLDSVHGESWREQAGEGAAGSQDRAPPAGGTMNREEAWEILGLKPGASEEEIVSAHRRLMQKLHPDRGGSGWLAAKINQAKDLLLGK